MGGSGGYRRLPGGSDDFLLQTDKQTLHHYIYIIIIIITIKPAWRYRAAGVRTSLHLESAGTGRTVAPCS